MLAVEMHKHINKENAVFLLLTYLFVHFLFLLIPLNNYSFMQGIRFLLTKQTPFVLFVCLFYQPEIRLFLNVKPFKDLAYFILSLSLVVVFLALLGGLKWNLAGVVEWLTAIGIFFALLARKTSKLESLLLSVLVAFVGGLIYEIPIYPFLDAASGIYVHYTFPFFVSNQWLFLPLLFFYLKKRFVFCGNAAYMFLASLCLFAFGLIYMQNVGNLYNNWLPRLPTIFYLAFLLKSLKLKIEGIDAA